MITKAIVYKISLLILVLLFSDRLSAQIGAGLRFGGNLSHLDGNSFRSAKKIGLQAGIALQYSFTRNLGAQIEPSFNISRVRSNEQTSMYDEGISKGTKSLHYVNVPLFFKLSITSKFALLAGPELSKLLNESKYRLNNGEEAFKDGTRVGYSLGLELGPLYFRYREVKRVSHVRSDWHAAIEQYQLGIKWDLF